MGMYRNHFFGIWPELDFAGYQTIYIQLEILKADRMERVSVCHRAKFCGYWSNSRGDMAIFQDGGHLPS